MKYKINEIVYWIPRGLSLFLVGFWLIMLLIYGFGPYFMAGLMVWLCLVLTTAICFKSPPFGGALFILFGAGYLIYAIGTFYSISYVFGALPLFMVGGLFIFDYFYQDKNGGIDDF
jgi:hypothetical protein